MVLPRLAIPSHNRASTISGSHGTLRFLADSGYPPDLIYIFVASQQQKDLYKDVVPSYMYGEIIVGALGLKEQRNFITSYFLEDEIIIQMDDDVRGIKSKPFSSFINLILKGVKAIEDAVGLWGIMPNDDGRTMEDKTTIHLAHIIGCFFICRNHKEVIITTTEKEDFERCILYYRLYGAVARYKGAGVVTKYEGGVGGLQEDGRHYRQLEGVRYMVETYPDYVKAVIKPKGQDIMLNWRAI